MRSLAPILVLAAAGSSLACARSAPPASAPSAVLGQTVSFSLPSDDGQVVRVPLPGSRVTVLDFFAPTCVPCRQKVPALVAREAALTARGARLVLVGVLADSESSDDARRALKEWGVAAPFLVDKGDVSRREAGVRVLPATIILDGDGNVKWVAPANASAEDVVGAVP